ncbi:MAG: hypothetical protein HFJ09_05410 [Lachnospiraceae bacterium]|nr:hypothetical protein [Lachnospiraceae bacterium]
MYEDRTQETIVSEMLENFGVDVRTDEGSLAYNACVKIASELEDTYADLDELNDNMLPDTQDLDHLIRYARERGIYYKYATNPTVKAEFQQDIEIGERFTCNDYIYTVTECVEGYNYKLECESEGTAANGNTGQLDPVDYVDEYEGGNIVEILEYGMDDEEEEEFRQRVLNSFESMAFGGNKADYRLYVDAISGVSGCKPKRREADSEWINIYITGTDNMGAGEELVKRVQEMIDPEESSGEGDGMAPICHKVKILSAEEKSINITTTILWKEGYSAGTSQSKIENAIEEYLKMLRKIWEENETNSITVRISQIEARILSVEEVEDIQETMLNNMYDNVSLDFTQIPILGGVTIV